MCKQLSFQVEDCVSFSVGFVAADSSSQDDYSGGVNYDSWYFVGEMLELR